MKYPKVRIKSNLLVREVISEPLSKLWDNGEEMVSQEQVDKKIESYRTIWTDYENVVISGMCEILDLEFSQNIIDVHIAPWMPSISSPLLISVIYSDQEFVGLLTHELIHRLLTDNTKLPDYPKERDLVADWYDLFGEEHSWQTIVHIPVHAILKYLYLDILNEPTWLRQDIEACRYYEDPGYKLAWNYVEAKGHLVIISQLKNLYDKIKLA